MFSKKNIFFSLGLLSFVSLTGCMSMATSSAQAVYNHQSIQKNVQDQYITMRAYQALDIDSKQFKNTNINVATLNGVVLLSGQVTKSWQKSEAERVVRKIAGVEDVYNWIQVDKPANQLSRLNDTWLTTKVKTRLIATDEVDASQIKVVTENGTVFLMGMLKPKEANAAAMAASHTPGVKQVVKIFSYIKISKTPV